MDDLQRLYIIDKYPVAKGAFGKVYYAQSKYDEDTLFAIKQMDI